MSRNRYTGQCYVCGGLVAPDTGHFEKIKGAKGWRVRHGLHPGSGRVTCEMSKREPTGGFKYKENLNDNAK